MLVYVVVIQHGRRRKSMLITLFQRILVFSYVTTDYSSKCPPLFRVHIATHLIMELQRSGVRQRCV